ncbi:cholinesterase [Rhynchophorus ferrugineus]|uniref:cholinesterase n=1 Tax=Rhynchophorus ferrugineus TaxID=354439 RepID=UPI003FCE7ECC
MTRISIAFQWNIKCLCIFIIFYCSLAKEYIVDIPYQGKIKGEELSKFRIQKIIAYYGIPYAQPPVGSLRFAAPVTDPLPSWDNIKNDTDFQPSCLQGKEDYKESELPFLQLLTDVQFPSNISEDCLYLNIFVPNFSPPSQGFATIIWIHPGNFTTGMSQIWNPHTLVYRQRVIIVTFGWRLNIMGFFTTMDGEASGNYGLMDQQAAMLWVKNNINLFGGNENNICLMGYGTGAISVGIHMINSGSRTLFHKAIVMSGNMFQLSAVRYPEEDKEIIDRLAKDFGCIRKPTSLFIDCLRRVDGNLLVQQTSNVNWRPLIDKDLSNSTSPFLSEPLKDFFDRDEYVKIPILTGYTNMEQALEFNDLENSSTTFNAESFRQLLSDLVSDDIPNINVTENGCSYNYDHIIDSVVFFYTPTVPNYNSESFRKTAIDLMLEKTYGSSTIYLASKLSKENQPTFVYRFDMKPSTSAVIKNIPQWVGVPHLFDLIYIWGVPYWRPDQEWDYRDKRISDTIMSFWTNFAKFSNPTQGTTYPIKWEAYTTEKPGLLIIDNTFNMSSPANLNYKAFTFWNEYYPKVLDVSTECCGTSGSMMCNLNISWLLILLSLLF